MSIRRDSQPKQVAELSQGWREVLATTAEARSPVLSPLMESWKEEDACFLKGLSSGQEEQLSFSRRETSLSAQEHSRGVTRPTAGQEWGGHKADPAWPSALLVGAQQGEG